MPIKQKTTDKQIEAMVQKEIDRLIADMIEQMLFIGNEALAYVRFKHGYTDQYGVLTSSTGYKVLYNGKDMGGGGFEVVLQGEEGAEQGKALIESLAPNYNKGIVLLFVAGAKYAAAVESGYRRSKAGIIKTTGYDVITGGKLTAERLIPQIMSQLGIELIPR